MTQDQTKREPGSTVLITGSSGFIGGRLVRAMAAKKVPVIAMYYHKLPDAIPNVFPICSDMSSPELLATPLRGVDTVFHLAWDSSSNNAPRDFSWDPNSPKAPRSVAITRNLVAAMERAGSRRIVFVSAVGASRISQAPFLKEKYLAEFLILNSRIPEKIIIRPSIVCTKDGPNDPFIRSIVRVMRFPMVYPVPCSKDLIAPLEVDDLVQTLLGIHASKITDSCALIELMGSEVYRIGEVFKLVSAKFAKGGRIPLGGPIGNGLLPFFERESKKVQNTPRLKDYLVLASKGDRSVNEKNPLMNVLPRRLHSFKDVLAAGTIQPTAQRPPTVGKH